MRLVGILMGYAKNDPAAQSEVAVFRDGLARLGWIEGSNLRIELRWGDGDADKEKISAKQLVDLQPNVIVSQTTVVTETLARETRTIPIVFVTVADPVASGFVANLAHPGGNITGLMLDLPEQGGKWVQLLKEIAPSIERVALLFNPGTAAPLNLFLPSIHAAASSAAIKVSVAPVHAKDEIESVIATQAHGPGGGLIVMPDPFNTANRELTIALAARYGVPTIYYNRLYAESGGLIAYGSDFTEQFREAATYVDRILKGAKPAELPVDAPTKFELIINLKTAKTLGLDVPMHLQQLCDKLIE
jgi:putative ABC transport system substrate-binding protein